MTKLKKALAVVLAAMLVFTALPLNVFAAGDAAATVQGFTDFPTGWSKNAMTDAVENGIIFGYEDSTVRPKDLLTRAQMAAIINRAFGAEIKAPIANLFSDVKQGDWFYTDIEKAIQMRTFQGYAGLMRPNDPITREDAISALSRALVIDTTDTASVAKFADGTQVSEYAKGYVSAFLARGYIHGYEDNTLKPKNNITREEFAQIMYNIFAAYERRNGAVALGDCEGEVVITGDNVYLHSTNVKGDLIIGDGVGNTNVTLENVNVEGRIVFRGGEGFVTLKNVTKGGLIVVNDYNGVVNFYHYSNEAIFTNAVYNTDATFLDRTVKGGSASGTGLGTHDTYKVGNEDAKTGIQEKPSTRPTVTPSIGGGNATPRNSVVFDLGANGMSNPYVVNQGTKFGDTFTNLPVPLKANRTDYAWYYDNDGDGTLDTEFTLQTVVSSNLTVKPWWKVDVKFTEEKGGTAIGPVLSILEGTMLASSQVPAAPTMADATFDDWYYNDGTEKKLDISTLVLNNHLEIYAKWTVDVRFYQDDTKPTPPVDTKTIAKGAVVDMTTVAAPAPVTGHTYEWKYLDGTEKTFDGSVVVNKHTDVYAKWTPEQYTIKFWNEGVDTDIPASYGQTFGAIKPADPTNGAWQFLGWYDNSDNKMEDTDIIDGTVLEVNAKWNKPYSVKFSVDGSFASPLYSENVFSGNTVASFPADPAHPTAPADYYFVGWFYNKGTTPTQLLSTDPIYHDIEATAKFEKYRKVSFYEDGTLASPYKTVNVKIGEYVQATDFPIASSTEATFIDWYYDNGGTETIFDSTVQINDEEVNVYAKWNVNVTFYQDDTKASAVDTKTIAKGAVVDMTTVAAPAPVTGHTYEWKYLDGTEKTFDGSVVVNKHTDVYAVWTKSSFSVTFWNESGIYDTKPVNYGDAFSTFKPADPSNDPWSFLGWVDGNGNNIDDGDIFDGTITDVYAKWNKPYSVKFSVDGNFASPLYSENVFSGSTVASFPADPAHPTAPADYYFVGWFYDKGGIDTQLVATDAILQDIEATARFEKYLVVSFYKDSTLGEFISDAKVKKDTTYDSVTVPGTPANPGFKFDDWYVDDTTKFEGTTAITTDIDVYGKWTALYNVNFYKAMYVAPSYKVGDTVVVESGDKVPVGKIDAATALVPTEKGYVTSSSIMKPADPTNYATTYTHEIKGQWFYLDDASGEYKVFDENVQITKDTDVLYGLYNLKFQATLPIIGLPTQIKLAQLYGDDTLAVDSVLDALYNSTNKSAIKTAYDFGLDKLLGKTIKVADLISYMPIDANKNIMNGKYDYRLYDLLGESEIRDMTDESIADMIETSSNILEYAVEVIIDSVTTDTAMLDLLDHYVTTDANVRNEFKAIIVEDLVTGGYSSAVADLAANIILADAGLRKSQILASVADPVTKDRIANKIVSLIHGDIDESDAFEKQIIDEAKKFYQPVIDDFINRLKNDDTFLINTEVVSGVTVDRSFIITAVYNKLLDLRADDGNGNYKGYAEIKAKLPSAIFKVLDEDILRDVFESTLDRYYIEVEAVYNVVNSGTYAGEEKYVSSHAEIILNPITQVLVPYFDKAMAKVDPALQGSKYYTMNPYIKELEALVDWTLLVTPGTTGEDYTGYKLREFDDYYSLVYRSAVLLRDAGQWFIDNVPETELDSVIDLAVKRLGAFYDKLATKITALTSGKIVDLKNRGEDLVAKFISKDNTKVWEKALTASAAYKLDGVYKKACDVVLDKVGFNISNEITVTIASDCKSVTLSQGTKVVTKTIPDIARDIQLAGYTVSVDGTVIKFNGRSIDVADYLKKAADKLGYTFKVQLADVTSTSPKNLNEYKLTVNNNEIKICVELV